jgi:hypothetical protein
MKGKLRFYCWKNGSHNPFIFDLPAIDKIGDPVFTNTIFEVVGCDRMTFVRHEAITVDLTEEVDAE